MAQFKLRETAGDPPALKGPASTGKVIPLPARRKASKRALEATGTDGAPGQLEEFSQDAENR
jgi:hypothetical protein